MVWTQQHCGQVHQLPPYTFAYLFLRTSSIWRHITSICICGFFEHHFYIWHGNFLLPIYPKHGRKKSFQYIVYKFVDFYNNFLSLAPATNPIRSQFHGDRQTSRICCLCYCHCCIRHIGCYPLFKNQV